MAGADEQAGALSKNGVAPRTAQAALPHSSLGLTMPARRGENVYTDPALGVAPGDIPAPETPAGGSVSG